MKFLPAIAAALLMIFLASAPTAAQPAPPTTTVTTTTAGPGEIPAPFPGATTTVSTTEPRVTVGQAVSPWLQYIVGVVLTILGIMMPTIAVLVNKKLGIDQNAAALDAEKKMMETIQSAATNGAGKVIMEFGNKLDGMVLLPKTPEIAAAVVQMSRSAADSVAKAGMSPDDMARMIINKVGILTAANPNVTPVTNPANVQASK